MPALRPLAIHLPQFHPVPENDRWWGNGFTDWLNVARARPRFPGHYQPQLPADLGFYDLRLPEARAAQADLAADHGIHGFCYYHYWFMGRRLLEHPVEEILRLGEPDFPFCFCWANENWTRRWDGLSEQVLMAQEYSAEDDRAHIEDLLRFFRDNRYVKVDGKPVFVVYRTELLPDPVATAELWRDVVTSAGFDGLYLIRVESFERDGDPGEIGFDASFMFEPCWPKATNRLQGSPGFEADHVYSYEEYVKARIADETKPDYVQFPGASPGWDNSPRRDSGALVLLDSNPGVFAAWLDAIVARFRPPSRDENFVFLNAWNEWAEGNHLEPCARWGTGYLEAVAHAFGRS